MTTQKMRLLGSPTSPFVRKVRVLILEAGLDGDVFFDQINPRDLHTDLRENNPLGKVPTLVLADGDSLFDSVVICDWIVQTNSAAGSFIPEERRWQVLKLEALADGLLDAGLLVRYENLRPAEEQSADWTARQMETVHRALASLEEKQNWRKQALDVGQISVACALDWLEFRFPNLGWQGNCSELAGWYREFAQRPSMLATAPTLA